MQQRNLLILHPRNVDAAAEPEGTRAALAQIGFLAEPFTFEGRRHFRPGEDFLQLITFLGCSPVVSLGEPGKTGEDFCHIALPEATLEPILLAGENAKAPRCPSCRAGHEEWRKRFLPGQVSSTALHKCDFCGHECPANALNWRQSAGIASSFIEVWGIFEGEAVPSQQLFDCLADVTDTPWTHFYFRGKPAL